MKSLALAASVMMVVAISGQAFAKKRRAARAVLVRSDRPFGPASGLRLQCFRFHDGDAGGRAQCLRYHGGPKNND